MILLSIGIITFYSYIVYTQPTSAYGRSGTPTLDYENSVDIGNFSNNQKWTAPKNGVLELSIHYNDDMYIFRNNKAVYRLHAYTCNFAGITLLVNKDDVIHFTGLRIAGSATCWVYESKFIPFK